jgi:hydrogenase-4 component E
MPSYTSWRSSPRLSAGCCCPISFCGSSAGWRSIASSSLVIGAFAVVFALAVSYRIGVALDLTGTIVVLALTVMLSMKLIGFLMLSVRHEALSQILGLLVLENGVFLGAQILVPGMPLLIEIVILFDLLIVVACFGVLVQYLLSHVGSTSSLNLRRLVG